jgi:predicted Zn-dependent protease with MMP-like domain
MSESDALIPTLADIEAIGRDAFDRLPEPFQRMCRDVVIRVEDVPDAEVCVAMGLDSPMDLLGLYHGVDVMRGSVLDVRHDLDRIYLYRLPILAEWRAGLDSLEAIVSHVLIHEIGHHFGFSDDDMARIETEDF